jgi:hypothetical protein
MPPCAGICRLDEQDQLMARAGKEERSFTFGAADTVVVFNGLPIHLSLNQVWDASDPLVLARPDLFNQVPDEIVMLRTARPASVVDGALTL